MNLVLKDDEQARVAVSFKDAKGQPAEVDGAPTWEVADENTATLDVAEDNMSVLVIAGSVGETLLTMRADADLTGEGVREIIGTLPIVVTAGEAQVVSLEPGAATKQGANIEPTNGGTTVDPGTGTGGTEPPAARRGQGSRAPASGASKSGGGTKSRSK